MPVLEPGELEASPLADLHAIAAELEIEGYRRMSREDVVAAILSAQGNAPPEKAGGSPDEPDDEPVDKPAGEEREGKPASAGRGAGGDPYRHARHPSERFGLHALGRLRARRRRRLRLAGADPPLRASLRRRAERAGAPAAALRAPPVARPRRSGQRCGRRAARRAARASPTSSRRSRPSGCEAPEVFASPPFGKGSRVAIAGQPGAGATTLLRELAVALAAKH